MIALLIFSVGSVSSIHNLNKRNVINMRYLVMVATLFIFLAAFAGCSNSSNLPTQPNSPEKLSSDTQILYSGSFDIDLDSQTISKVDARQSDFVYNITGFLPDKCPGGCFRFTIVGVVGTVLEIELTIENPLALQVYDVRIQYLNTFGKTVLNPDSYIDYLGTPITGIYPFTAFAKDIPNRAFPVGPGGIDTETLFLDFPPGAPSSVNYAITASLPDQLGEPYEIGDMAQDGILTPAGGMAIISCKVYDHQDNISAVFMDASPFTGAPLQLLPGAVPDSFECELENTLGAPVGLYNQLIMALSPNPQGISTYNYVQIEVTDDTEDIIYVDDSNTTGIEDGTQAHPYDTIPEGLNAAPAGFQVWVDDSGNDYEGPVTTKSEVILKSVNWDSSDGSNMAAIYRTGSGAVVSMAADSTIDGFKVYGSSTAGFSISNDNATVRNCWITQIGLIYASNIVEGMRISNCDGAVVDNCEFSNIQLNSESGILDCIYCMAPTNVTITRCRIHDFDRNTDSGILIPVYFNTVDGIEFHNNLIYDIDSPDNGINIGVYWNTSINSNVTNNVIVDIYEGGNSVSAIYVGEESTGFVGLNNILGDFTGNGISASAPDLVWNYNDIYNTTSGGHPLGTGNITDNPLFVNPGVDFHLDTGSPCIDTGDPTILDYDSSRSDIGCYGGPLGDW